MSAHTPGPWSVLTGTAEIIGSDGTMIGSAFIGDDKGEFDVDRVMANARLIAAAPELLDALESIRQYGIDTLSGRADGPDDREWQRGAVLEMTRRARAAVNKASVSQQ